MTEDRKALLLQLISEAIYNDLQRIMDKTRNLLERAKKGKMSL